MPYANDKGADQPAHMRSLISAFVVHCLDSTYTCYSQSFKTLASLSSWAGWFESYLVQNPEDRFSRDEAHYKDSYQPEVLIPLGVEITVLMLLSFQTGKSGQTL